MDKLWLAILAAGAGPATCAHVRRTLSAALNSAVERGHLARNPVLVSQPPRYDAPEVEPLTAADARKVLAVAANRRNAARWSVALALGIRQGEPLGLRWSNVDLDEGRLTVRAQLQHLRWQHGCAAPEVGPTCGRDPGRCPSRQEDGGGRVAGFVQASVANAGQQVGAALGRVPTDASQKRARSRQPPMAAHSKRLMAADLWVGRALESVKNSLRVLDNMFYMRSSIDQCPVYRGNPNRSPSQSGAGCRAPRRPSPSKGALRRSNQSHWSSRPGGARSRWSLCL